MFESAATLDSKVRRAYLARLGVEEVPPSADALRLLVQRHVERVPFESLWIHAGQAWSIDPHESARRIALDRRGGYCFHLNGGLGLLLGSLGYAVRGHVGGVHGQHGPDPAAMGDHLALTVGLLPTETNPGGNWYVDCGLGDTLHDPLPMISGWYDQPPYRLSLEQAEDGSEWHLRHDPAEGRRGMTWRSADGHWRDFAAKHRWLSTSPESGFVQVPTAQRRDARGADVIRGLVLTRIGREARTSEPVTVRADWFDLLAQTFDLPLDALNRQERDRLWASALGAHRRWVDSAAASG